MKINKYLIQNTPLKIVFFFLIFLSAFSSNPLLTILSLVLFALILIFFWRPGLLFIFAFIMLWQWLQVTIKIFYADILNIGVEVLSDTGSADEAIILSMIGLFSLGAGILLAVRNLKPIELKKLKNEARNLSIKKLFIAYLIFSLLNSLITEIMFNYPSITQILVGLLNIKLMMIVLIFLITLLSKQELKWMALVILIEVIMGFTQYFSGFKEVLFYVIIIAMTLNNKISFKLAFRSAIILIVILIFSVLWLSVRTDYRDYLNQGTGQQAVLVPVNQRLNHLADLASQVKLQDIDNALELAVFRTSYTDIFGQVIDRVPSYTKFENGYILYNSFLHVLMPRFLFPHKKIIYDSEKTNYYTGKNYATDLQGTAVGLGYMAEFYIDFGYYMFIAIFLLGYFYGRIYK